MKHIVIICDYLLQHELIDENKYREIFRDIGKLSNILDDELKFFYNENFVGSCLPFQSEHFALRVGSFVGLSQLGVYGIGLSLQDNIGEAINFAIKYQEILWPLASAKLGKVGKKYYLKFESCFSKEDGGRYKFSLEYHISLVYGLLRSCGHQCKITSVSFDFVKPDVFDFICDFFDCAVLFGNQSYIEFEILSVGGGGYDKLRRNYLHVVEQYLDKLIFLNKKMSVSMHSRIFCILDAWYEGDPTEERLAESLKMHPRTMRRRLEKEGLTFRQVMVEYRRQKAEFLLRTTDMSIKQISFKLWFKSGSSFSKAFEGWVGLRPGEYRNKNI